MTATFRYADLAAETVCAWFSENLPTMIALVESEAETTVDDPVAYIQGLRRDERSPIVMVETGESVPHDERLGLWDHDVTVHLVRHAPDCDQVEFQQMLRRYEAAMHLTVTLDDTLDHAVIQTTRTGSDTEHADERGTLMGRASLDLLVRTQE